jgi:FixJ family two-component response regulator
MTTVESAGEASVYVVDDDDSMRRALSRRLEAEGFVVASFGSGEDFLAQVPADAVGCVLLDVRMPGLDGFAVQSTLLDRCAYLRVVFLTAHADVPSTVRAMKCGANDVLTKPVRGARLIDAVNATIAVSLLRRSEQSAHARLRTRYARLTSRERQVFDRVATGQLNKQVAHNLGIAERTVKAHRAQVMKKMGASTAAELATMYVTIRPDSL